MKMSTPFVFGIVENAMRIMVDGGVHDFDLLSSFDATNVSS